MSNLDTLKKAVQIAITGGWTPTTHDWFFINKGDVNWEGVQNHLPEIIYNHDFARALWGEGEHGLNEVNGHWYEVGEFDERSYIEILPTWQYHLQQMVIADDPLQYLADNIPEASGDSPD